MQGMPASLPESFSLNPQGAEIGLWPLAWGWWLVIVVSIISILATTTWLIRRYKRRSTLRKALVKLAQIETESQDALALCNQLLKRAFMSYFPAQIVASLHGKQWTEFMASQLKPKKISDFTPLFDALDANLYKNMQSDSAYSQEDMVRLAANYLKATLPPGKKQLAQAEGGS